MNIRLPAIVLSMALAACATPAAALPTDPVECLALNLYHEIRGGSELDRIAVASVVMNRVRSPRFPSTVCGVIGQRGQFSWVRRPGPVRERSTMERMRSLAREVIAGLHRDPTGGALFFHRPGTRLGVRGRIGLATRAHLYVR